MKNSKIISTENSVKKEQRKEEEIMKKGTIVKRLWAILFAAVLALVPLGSAAAAENGRLDVGVGIDVEGKVNNLPEEDHAASVTVHKYLRSTASATVGTGDELTDTELDGFGIKAGAGIKFTLTPITMAVDENTTVADVMASASNLGTGITKATDDNGDVKWDVSDGIVTGYYLLEEDGDTTPAGYTPMAPVIIALPYAVGDNDWNYDIHVYPKNVGGKDLVKEVVDEEIGYSVGDLVTWKYTSIVDTAKLYDGTVDPAKYGTYVITDTFDTRLAFNSTQSVIGTDLAKYVPLVENTDYTVDTSTAGKAVYSLTEAGIKKMADNGLNNLEITFDTKITSDAYTEGSSEISNGGKLDWDDSEGVAQEDGYEIPEEEKPSVKLYNIEIEKTNNDGTKLLDGAQFKIASSEADAKAGIYLTDANGDAIVITGPNPADTTNYPGGWALFAGLPVTPNADTTYWLVEVIAPSTADGDYVRIDQPIEVTIKDGDIDTLVTIKNYLPTDDDIPEKWKLPLTGGMGTVIFYVIGVVVMMGSIAVFVKSRKAKSTH